MDLKPIIDALERENKNAQTLNERRIVGRIIDALRECQETESDHEAEVVALEERFPPVN